MDDAVVAVQCIQTHILVGSDTQIQKMGVGLTVHREVRCPETDGDFYVGAHSEVDSVNCTYT